MKKVIAVAVILLITFGLLGGCAKESASIGIIGGADGPTAIFVSPGCSRSHE